MVDRSLVKFLQTSGFLLLHIRKQKFHSMTHIVLKLTLMVRCSSLFNRRKIEKIDHNQSSMSVRTKSLRLVCISFGHFGAVGVELNLPLKKRFSQVAKKTQFSVFDRKESYRKTNGTQQQKRTSREKFPAGL